MDTTQLIAGLRENLFYVILAVVALSLFAYVIVRFVLIRLVKRMVMRSATKGDDILVSHLHLTRMALLAPFVVIYASASIFPETEANIIAKVSLFIILWLTASSLVSLLTGINAIYENRPNYNGVSIKGYLDIGKLLVVLIAIILSITLITDQSPVALLAGLGAITAVLMLIFQNTILSMVASVRITSNDLLKRKGIL